MAKHIQQAATNRKRVKDTVEELVAEQPVVETKKQKTSTKTAEAATESRAVYLGHIPKGFHEREIRVFFSQFGDTTRVKLFRSKKTGNSKGYAFIEFAEPETAQVVADAINGYLLYDRQLVCHVVPPNKCHEGMFLLPKKVKSDEVDEDENTDAEAPSNDKKKKVEKDATARATRTQQKKLARLQELGIDFNLLK